MNKNCFLGETDYQTRLEESLIVFLPVPFDLTSTWQKGADKGPAAILEASPNLEFYDIETDTEVYKQGLFTETEIRASDSEEMITRVYQTTKKHIEANRFVVPLGGEHSVSIGSVKAHVEKYPGLSVLQLDAHADLRETYNGSRYNHACVMARIKEYCPVVQAGIRSMDASERDRAEIGRIFFAHDMLHSDRWIHSAVDCLSEHVYITIDLDVFDSGIMPSTGTPEPGGLSWYDVMNLLRRVSEQKTIVGFDVVELCPSEHNKAPDFLAAKLIYKLLSYIWR